MKKEHLKKPISILVVEDEQEVCESLVHSLSLLYDEVVYAYNGKEAMNILKSEDYAIDIVITDLNMPVMCGADLISYLNESYVPYLPIVVVSAHSDISCNYNNLENISVLNKPFRIDKLCTLIDDMTACKLTTNKVFKEVQLACESAKALIAILKGDK